MITVAAAAAILGVNKRTVYDLAAPRGPIPCYRIGRAVHFEQADLDAYLASRRCEPFDPVKEAGQARLQVVHLKASNPDGMSELQKLFQSYGLRVDKKKPIGSKRKRIQQKK